MDMEHAGISRRRYVILHKDSVIHDSPELSRVFFVMCPETIQWNSYLQL